MPVAQLKPLCCTFLPSSAGCCTTPPFWGSHQRYPFQLSRLVDSLRTSTVSLDSTARRGQKERTRVVAERALGHSQQAKPSEQGSCTSTLSAPISHVRFERPSEQVAFPNRPYAMKRLDPSVDQRLRQSMPVTAASPVQSTFPFVSVFGNGLHASAPVVRSPSKVLAGDKKSQLTPAEVRRDSGSTAESLESSPTNSMSTYGSSMTETSPSSSPESPPTISPKHVFQPPSGAVSFSSSYPTLPGIEASNKKRNTKNLSVNTLASRSSAPQPATKAAASAPFVPAPIKHTSSAPPTPGFILPPKPPRRKPSNLGLTITTPESSSSVALFHRPADMASISPDPQLQSIQQSSSPPMFSPATAGTMRLASLSNPSSRAGSLSISPSSISSPIKKQTLEHVKEETDFDGPLSQEVKSPAYPQGPVCIYEPYVHLYLEPTQVEAREFDVVLNVAREVQNPFQEAGTDKGVQVSVPTADKGVQVCFDDQDKDTHTPVTTSASRSSEDDYSASTPRAPRANPEYIHIPWDHNTNVVDDLLRLCQLIDERVRQRKRVLVHCQCGVSRSASLVVAYGIYRNRSLTVQEAYDAVKSRSRWIGPNMNLIYQLAEFKSKLAKSVPTPGWRPWRSSAADLTIRPIKVDIPVSPRRNSTPKPSGSPALDDENALLSTSAPLRSFQLPDRSLPPAAVAEPTSAFPADRASAGLSPLSRGVDRQAAGLASAVDAPKQNPFSALAERAPWSKGPAVEENAPRSVVEQDKAAIIEENAPPTPMAAVASDLQSQDLANRDTPTSSVRARASPPPPLSLHAPAAAPIPPPSQSALQRNIGLGLQVPATPAPLSSPRAADFTASPFHLGSADASTEPHAVQELMSPRAVDRDPRSPHHRGEAPITRNIADLC